MSILDTTIVNVALETLSRELDAPLSTIQWVSTGYLLALATVIPLTGWTTERFGSKRIWMISVVAVRRRQRALRAGLVGRVADRLPRAAGLRRRHDHAGRDGAARPDRGPAAGRAGDERGRRADAARADPRPGDRRPDRRLGLVALDLLRQRADRAGRARAGGAAAARPTRAAPTPAGSTGSGCCCSRPASALFVFGLSESESHGGFADPSCGGRSSAGVVLVALFVRHALRARRGR